MLKKLWNDWKTLERKNQTHSNGSVTHKQRGDEVATLVLCNTAPRLVISE